MSGAIGRSPALSETHLLVKAKSASVAVNRHYVLREQSNDGPISEEPDDMGGIVGPWELSQTATIATP